MKKRLEPSPISIPNSAKQSIKPSIRRSKGSTNPNRRKMTVSVSETFEEIHDMNQKALKRLAKQA